MTTIEVEAVVVKVATLADSGLRIWLDLDESAIPQAALLMDCQRRGVVLWCQLSEVDYKRVPRGEED